MKHLRNSNKYLAAIQLSVVFISKSSCDSTSDENFTFQLGQTLTNWSSTHSTNPRRLYEPKSSIEITQILANSAATKSKIRPIGTALSPNGIGMNGFSGDLISLGDIDYVQVDREAMKVTVGAGARVSQILKELSKYGLTLQNFSSIQEQQIAGWTQVAAHGTGAVQ